MVKDRVLESGMNEGIHFWNTASEIKKRIESFQMSDNQLERAVNLSR